jgi:hypothetical protein
MVRRVVFAAVLVLAAQTGVAAAGDDPHPGWVLFPGLDLQRFDVDTRLGDAHGDVHVLRVDPRLWRLSVLAAARHADGDKRTLAAWGRDFALTAAVNAGMYQEDGSTHVGFCQVDGEVLHGAVNKYQSAFVCDPVAPADSAGGVGDPPFAIVDLDVIPLDELRTRYRTVVQNLRLIKYPRENRWSPTRDRWREVALAQDEEGRALFVLCTRSLSMHEFNEMLLELPLGVVAAQHLEGSGAAGLWARTLPQDYDRALIAGSPVPNVLAVTTRGAGAAAPGDAGDADDAGGGP